MSLQDKIAKRRYQRIAEQLLVAIRSDVTQAQFASRLNVASAQISRWETSAATISWADFIKVCSSCGLSLKKHMRRIGLLVDSIEARDILKEILPNQSVRKVAATLSVSSSTLGRWLTGESIPSLANMLYIIDKSSRHLCALSASLVDIQLIPELKDEYEIHQDCRRLFAERPVTPLVHCFLFLESYRRKEKHEQGCIAEVLGIPIEEETTILNELTRLGMASFNGKIYEPASYSIAGIGTDEDTYRQERLTRSFWLERLAQMAAHEKMFSDRTTPGGRCSSLYEIYAVSKEARRRVRALQNEFCNRLYQILEEDDDPKKEVLQVMTMAWVTYSGSEA